MQSRGNDSVDAQEVLYHAHYGRAETLAKLGRYRDAIDDFDQAVRLQPGAADPLIERGFAYGEAGDFAFAVGDLTRSLRMEPSNSPLNVFKSMLLG